MIYSINGITAHTEEIRTEDNELSGYTVLVNGEQVGNRIERYVFNDHEPTFISIARNELIIAYRDTLHEAVADVINEGMRDRTRR